MLSLEAVVRRVTRTFGWELRHYDPDLTVDTYLWMLFSDLGINCVLDVGAHHGEYRDLLRKNGYRGHIMSFEPIEESLDILRKRSLRDARWKVYPYALGRTATNGEINVTQSTNYSSFLSPMEHAAQEFEGDVTVRREAVSIRRLDEVFHEIASEIPRPSVYLKMDTQGWDLEVFAGADGILDCVYALQSELSIRPLYAGMPDWLESLAKYQGCGFDLSAVFPVARDSQLRLTEIDCIFVRQGWRATRGAQDR